MNVYAGFTPKLTANECNDSNAEHDEADDGYHDDNGAGASPRYCSGRRRQPVVLLQVRVVVERGVVRWHLVVYTGLGHWKKNIGD